MTVKDNDDLWLWENNLNNREIDALVVKRKKKKEKND
jgi:hypothetical protein